MKGPGPPFWFFAKEVYHSSHYSDSINNTNANHDTLRIIYVEGVPHLVGLF